MATLIQNYPNTWLKSLAFVGMIIGLPLFVWYCQIAIVHYQGQLVMPSMTFWRHMAPPTVEAIAFYGGWLIWQAALYHFLPGRRVLGQPLNDGSRLPYTLNGLLSFVFTIGLWFVLHVTDLLPGHFFYTNLGSLLTTANIIVFILCIYMYWLGRQQANLEEKTKHPIDGFFVGVTLNPRNGLFDWKFFCESRPGLTLWVIASLSCAAHQYQLHGVITNAMLLVSFFIGLYVIDYYVFEEAILTTWDIIHEPFGWMLCWGSLIYVPFFYPLSSYWLAENAYQLPAWAVPCILAIGVSGYVIFRQANLQKHRFRQAHDLTIWGKPATFIQTAHGSKLLTSGWWGIASHINYLGDLLLALAMGLVLGTNTLFGYAYFLTFLVLLIHRDWRDNKHCATKYGEDWQRYRAKVRWHMLPGVY